MSNSLLLYLTPVDTIAGALLVTRVLGVNPFSFVSRLGGGRTRRLLRTRYGLEISRADARTLDRFEHITYRLSKEKVALRLDAILTVHGVQQKLMVRLRKGEQWQPFPAINDTHKPEVSSGSKVGRQNRPADLDLIETLRRLDNDVNERESDLPEFYPALYRTLSADLHAVLPGLYDGERYGIEQRYTIERIINEYLPALYTNTLNLVGESAATEERESVLDSVSQQLTLLAQQVRQIRRARFEQVSQAIEAQGSLLADKFTDTLTLVPRNNGQGL